MFVLKLSGTQKIIFCTPYEYTLIVYKLREENGGVCKHKQNWLTVKGIYNNLYGGGLFKRDYTLEKQ